MWNLKKQQLYPQQNKTKQPHRNSKKMVATAAVGENKERLSKRVQTFNYKMNKVCGSNV